MKKKINSHTANTPLQIYLFPTSKDEIVRELSS